MSLAAQELGVTVVAGVDRDADALRTFERNFPSAEAINGSVRSHVVVAQCGRLLRPPGETPGPTIVLSGPPCQGFSAAGSRDPADPRNRILVSVARAIAVLLPDCALVENVSGVLSGKHSERLTTFEEVLTNAGYNVCHVVLDAADFGVAQNRRRAFFLISTRELDLELVRERLEELKQPSVTVADALDGLPEPLVRPDDYDDQLDYEGVANHFSMRHSQRVMHKISALEPGTGPMSYRRLHPRRQSNTLFSGHRAPPAHFSEPRSITTREGARLQGFPDEFRIYGVFSKQMEQVANAVPPPLARAALQVLLELSEVPAT